jgi:superfamily II DNA/RNA helicase
MTEPLMTFSTLGLAPALLRAVSERNYTAPTAIQSAAIPAILQGQDVLASAQTGSGKTAAFALPLLQRWQDSRRQTPRRVNALILAPTRELAAQIGDSLRGLAQYLAESPKIAVVFGGVSINPQMMELRGGADLVVATPGRLLDLLDHNALRLDGLATLVLDEADRLFDLGFAEEIGRLLKLLPDNRQNLFFSATFPTAVQSLAAKLLHRPTRIEVRPAAGGAPDIKQRAIAVDTSRRTQLLRQMIKDHRWPQVLVFVATKYAADTVAAKLGRAGIQAAALHGELSQGARSQALADFKAGRLQVLLATDLAARGIDIAELPVVVNYDLPRSAVDYTHRIGRTGRAGESGLAINFITADAEAHFRLIEKRHNLRLPREEIAGFEPSESAPPVAATADANGGIKGKRKSKKDKLREAAARGE